MPTTVLTGAPLLDRLRDAVASSDFDACKFVDRLDLCRISLDELEDLLRQYARFAFV